MESSKKRIIDISIIIPLFKGQKFCDRLLNMVEKNCLYHNLFKECTVEILFVNDYPDEKIFIENKVRHFTVKIISQKRNMGIHASRVKGIRNALGEYVIMFDQDDLVSETWLYSQWHKIRSENSDYCVCNGWKGRFQVILEPDRFNKVINDINYYLSVKNPICSPGQVIFRRKSTPQEWMENIQAHNGSDDFFLWILVLKKGFCFSVNEEYLYYHTPERNYDSINLQGMLYSLKETAGLLDKIKILSSDEADLLNKQIHKKEHNDYIKFQKMFHTMLDWIKLKNKGISIYDYLIKNNYLNIAIYGLGYIGEYLYDELNGTNIKIRYGIDYSSKDCNKELDIFRITDKLEDVDVIIITASRDEKEIVQTVRSNVTCPVITIADILLELRNDIESKPGDFIC